MPHVAMIDFKHMIRILWNHYSAGGSVTNTIELLLPKKYFQFPEVCSATVAYWFHRFSNDFYFPAIIPIIRSVSFNLRVEFVMAMTISFPAWTKYHYMDALKINPDAVETYLGIVEKYKSGQQVFS
ncbi:hypothetical protein M0802_014182 [Mischocyttarus mexicanus]|nr:hypothetical protein M0802_014308 [Mischocyttarus mexicanus]KAI4480491.1 hypothetical protein M0802_014182 [Mischocyttarus mexicanus]